MQMQLKLMMNELQLVLKLLLKLVMQMPRMKVLLKQLVKKIEMKLKYHMVELGLVAVGLIQQDEDGQPFQILIS